MVSVPKWAPKSQHTAHTYGLISLVDDGNNGHCGKATNKGGEGGKVGVEICHLQESVSVGIARQGKTPMLNLKGDCAGEEGRGEG